MYKKDINEKQHYNIMLKKNKMKMDPSRINNYNKFLITLDKTEDKPIDKEKPIDKDKNESASIGKTEQINSKINAIIDKMLEEYKKKGHDSSNFT